MRKIKFRGKTKGGKFIFGDLAHDGDKVLIRSLCADYYEYVEPESVAQFVGHDAHGNEVYEGDRLLKVDRPTEELIVSSKFYEEDFRFWELVPGEKYSWKTTRVGSP